MAADPRVAGRLLRHVQAYNRKLMLEATIDAVMGILFTTITSGVVFCIAWFVCISLGGRRFPASTVALCATGIYFLVSAISAWRHVDPFAGLKPMSEAEHLLLAASSMVDVYVHMNRHTVAGLSLIMMGGPVNLVSALGSWLHRLPADATSIEQAVEILCACHPEVDLKKFKSSMPAAVMLRRLNLIVPRGESTLVKQTEKGRDIVGK